MDGLLANTTLMPAMTSWILAQVSKVLIHLLRERKLRIQFLFSAGGMPSAHSALVSALA